MDDKFYLKYKKILDILPDVAECTNKQLILVGGTALALFYTKHRISIDLDFIPIKKEDEVTLKEKLKGCLTNKGYATKRAAYQNQFVVQFEDTSIKVEVFSPDYEVQNVEKQELGTSSLLVASLNDILQLKIASYSDRLAARDLFDIYHIFKKLNKLSLLAEIIKKNTLPKNFDDLEAVLNKDDLENFKKVIMDAS